MKLGQFLDKVDVMTDARVDIWVKCREYSMVGGVPQWVWKQYHTVHEKPMFHDEVDEYRDNTLVSCYIGVGADKLPYLECMVKE